MPTQEEQILFFLRSKPNGILKQDIMQWSLNNFITEPTRILRKLAEKEKVRGVKEEGSKTKRWYFIPKDKTGQAYLL